MRKKLIKKPITLSEIERKALRALIDGGQSIGETVESLEKLLKFSTAQFDEAGAKL